MLGPAASPSCRGDNQVCFMARLKPSPSTATDLFRSLPQPLELCLLLWWTLPALDLAAPALGFAVARDLAPPVGAQVSVQRTDANLGHRAATPLVKLQGVEELFNALSVVPSAHIDYQQRVEPVSYNDNAVVIGCTPASDGANVSGGVSPKREAAFAKQLGVGAGKAGVSGRVQNLFYRPVFRTTRIIPPTTAEGRIFRCSHVKTV